MGKFSFPAGNHGGSGCVAEHIDGGTGHIHHAVDAGDDGDTFQGNFHLGEDDGTHEQTCSRNANGTDGRQNTHEDDFKLFVERHGNTVQLGHEGGYNAHIDGRTVHIDGVAERDGKRCDGLGSTELLHLDEFGGKCCCAGAGGEGNDRGGGQHPEEEGKAETAGFDEGNLAEEDMENVCDVHDADDLDERQQYGCAMTVHGECNESEYTDGGVGHDHIGHFDHDFGTAFKKVEYRFPTFAHSAQAESEDHGKEDDLEHIALAHGVDGIEGDDVKENIHHSGVLHGLSLESLDREVETFSGI